MRWANGQYPTREDMRKAIGPWLISFLFCAQVLAQDTTLVKAARITDPRVGVVVPLKDLEGFQAAVLKADRRTTERSIRRLVRANGRSKKVKDARGERYAMGLYAIPEYLMALPEVLLCLMLPGQNGEYLLVVEYAHGIGRLNRVYRLRNTKGPVIDEQLPKARPKGRWKMVGVLDYS